MIKLKDLLTENDNKFNKWVVKELSSYLKDQDKNIKHFLFCILHITKSALIDANSHKEAKMLEDLFIDAEFDDSMTTLSRANYVKLLHDKGKEIAAKSKWDGKLIVQGISEFLKSRKIKNTPEKLSNLVEVLLKEDYSETYFQSFADAAQFARDFAEKKGYDVDEDEWFSEVATGGRYTRSRPSKGKSHRFTIGLLKNGKPQRKALHFQVYGMDSGNYELNVYIS